MEFSLPVTKYTVVLFDYVPQRVFERYQEIIAGDMSIDLKDANVTIERVAEVLGPDRALQIQQADETQRQQLLDEARKEIIMQNVKMQIRIADQHVAEREKVKGMVREVRDGEKTLAGFDPADLPKRDYALIQTKIADIEAAEAEEVGK